MRPNQRRLAQAPPVRRLLNEESTGQAIEIINYAGLIQAECVIHRTSDAATVRLK